MFDYFEVSEQVRVEIPNTGRSSGHDREKRKNLTKYENVRTLVPWHKRLGKKSESERKLSWASKNGLKPYDEILEINGV